MKRLSIFTSLVLLASLTSCTPSHDSMKKLNAKWECDYLSFNINKKWELSEGNGMADSAYGCWTWDDTEGHNYIRFTAYKFDLYKKLSNYQARDYYDNNKEPEDMKSESSFVVNNQAYIVVSKSPDGDNKKIIFYADKLKGCFEYAYYDETIVKEIVNSISFKEIK